MTESVDLGFLDLGLVHDYFNKALLHEDINIQAYLEGFNELYKFFQLMGTVFGFVSTDLKQKIEILQALNKKDQDNYLTVKKMIEYEKDNDLLRRNDFVNGARTLLRLHRGLDFISEFLRQLKDLSDSENTSVCCQDAYNKTLAQHHPWLIRKAAIFAMYTMPTREMLFRKVSGEDVQKNIDILPKMLEVTADVTNRIQKIFETHKLHTLP